MSDALLEQIAEVRAALAKLESMVIGEETATEPEIIPEQAVANAIIHHLNNGCPREVVVDALGYFDVARAGDLRLSERQPFVDYLAEMAAEVTE